MSIALRLFRDFNDYISAKLIFEQPRFKYRRFRHSGSLRFSGLHCASFFGVTQVVVVLIELGCYYINREDDWESTLLIWAAYSGHGEAVKTLLGWGVNPEESDSWPNPARVCC